MNDISIDIETLSARFNAALLSIGAVAFDRRTAAIGEKLYVEIEIESSLLNGHVSGTTLEWWMQQSDAARRVFGGRDKPNLAGALQRLSTFVNDHPGARVWGNGATFDITILEHAYDRLNLEAPWKFWNIRDMRTILDAATEAGFDKRGIPFQGVAHNAVDDAEHQARIIAAGWAYLCQSRCGGDISPHIDSPQGSTTEAPV